MPICLVCRKEIEADKPVYYIEIGQMGADGEVKISGQVGVVHQECWDYEERFNIR